MGCPHCEAVDIVVIMDRSGSMSGVEDDTIGAFNSFLKEQKEVPGDAKLTLILFDDKIEVVHDRVDIKRVMSLTKNIYFVRGSTALYDAIGHAIAVTDIANKSNKVIFLIQSDGFENSSREFTGSQVKRLISEREEAGWDFNFIGTGIDAIVEGAKFGMQSIKCASYSKSSADFAVVGSTMSTTSTNYRTK